MGQLARLQQGTAAAWATAGRACVTAGRAWRRVWLAAVASVAVVAWLTGFAHAADLGAAAPRDTVLWRVPTRSHDIALTFDDGPSPVYTPQVLRLLRHNDATATFFVVGTEAARHAALVRAEAAQGSQVCGHGWTHMLFRRQSAAAVRRSVERTAALLARLGVPACDLFRFPYFASDGVARRVVGGLGYRMIGANVDTLDWRQPPVPRMVGAVLRRLRPGDIVLFHDGGGVRSGSVRALGAILAALPGRGLRAVTVGRLLAAAEPGQPLSSWQ